jgi:acyl-coenzyme A thioesterase PaaI-like protein
MEVTDIPFNRHINIERSDGTDSSLLAINASNRHLNHIGTVHACVQLSLAEAASGEFLAETFPHLKDQVFGVLRRVEAKFKNPMTGKIAARAVSVPADLDDAARALAAKGRAIFSVTVEIVDGGGAVGLLATFHWYIQANSPSNAAPGVFTGG